MSITITGLLDKIIFRDERTAATYLQLRVPESVKERNPATECITVSAYVPEYAYNTPLKVEGEWKKSHKGLRLVATSVKEEIPEAHYAIEFLSSGLVAGVGRRTAEEVVKVFGTDLFARAASDPSLPKQMADAVKGMNIETAAALCAILKNTVTQRELFEFILSYGGYYGVAMKLYRVFGAEAKKKLLENPYIGMEYGMTFAQCDCIGRDQGFHAANPIRLRSVVQDSLRRSASYGHCFVSQQRLMQDIDLSLEQAAFENTPTTIPYSVISSVGIWSNQAVVTETIPEENKSRIFAKPLFEAEVSVAENVKRLQKTSKDLAFTESLISWAEKKLGITYSEQQKKSFHLLKKSGVSVVTGGPGTGKTTTVNGLIRAFERMYPDKTVRLCAPTGRAAQRMCESTGQEAVTIHRLLEYAPFGNDVSHKDASNPIDADMIVVDETSMLDVELASILLSAVKDGTLVLFVGDIDQLPSVGAGDVLSDLIASKEVETYQLTTVYRQAAESKIISNATHIRKGETKLEVGDDFKINQVTDDDQMLPIIIEEAVKHWDPTNPFATQILCPTHKGPAGVVAINSALQKRLNPAGDDKPELRYGGKVYRKGDKIILTNNNYSAGYYNGDLGTVSDVKEGVIIVSVLGREIELTRDMLEDINLAYAMTIHKAQGSEFKRVILSLPFRPTFMLKRNLLYTAITRARSEVCVVSEAGALNKAILTKETGMRNTCLKERLCS